MSSLLSADTIPEDNPFSSSPHRTPSPVDNEVKDQEAIRDSDEQLTPPPLAPPAEEEVEDSGSAVQSQVMERKESSGAIKLRDNLAKKDAIQVFSSGFQLIGLPAHLVSRDRLSTHRRHQKERLRLTLPMSYDQR
jgi:hypothetical protein